MPAPSEVAFARLLFAGIGFMVLAAGAILLFFVLYRRRFLQQQQALRRQHTRHQQRMLATMVETQETERQRIGQELHDGIGSTVATAQLLAGRLCQTPPPPNAAELLALLHELLGSAVQDTRSLARSLYPVLLIRLGLAEALRHLVATANETHHVRVTLEQPQPPPLLPLPQQLALYRICQELMANSLRHAHGATYLRVSLLQPPGQLVLCVEDDGCGFAPTATPGVGLRSIELRAQLLQARLQQHAAPGQGTRTEIILSVPEA